MDVAPFTRRVAAILGLTALTVLLLLFLWYAAQGLLIIFAGCLAGVFLSGLSNWTSKKTGLGYGWSLLAVTLLLLAAAAAMFVVLASQLAQQAQELSRSLTEFAQQARDWVEQFGWGENLLEQMEEGEGDPATQIMPAVEILSTMSAAVTGALLIAVIGLYLAANPHWYVSGALRLVPPAKRHRADEVMQALGRALRGWLLAQFISMAVIGSLVAVGLLLFGIELWLILGVLAGLLTFIPNLGPIIAGIPTVLIGFTESSAVGFGVLAYFVFVQMFEGYFVTPMVQDRVIRLPPAGILAAQVLAAYTLGFLGLALAAPLLAVVMVAVEMLYVQDALGDRQVKITGEDSGM